MLRIICKQVHIEDSVYGGAKEATEIIKTFDVDLQEVENYLKQSRDMVRRSVVGIEVLETKNV